MINLNEVKQRIINSIQKEFNERKSVSPLFRGAPEKMNDSIFLSETGGHLIASLELNGEKFIGECPISELEREITTDIVGCQLFHKFMEHTDGADWMDKWMLETTNNACFYSACSKEERFKYFLVGVKASNVVVPNAI